MSVFDTDLYPVDSLAARVTARGFQYEEAKKITCEHWDAPPEDLIVPMPKSGLDLKGVKFGRMVVYGYLGRKNKQKTGRWLVRCSCGRYEVRSAKSIQNPLNKDDHCQKCEHLRYLKRQDYYRRTGRWPDEK